MTKDASPSDAPEAAAPEIEKDILICIAAAVATILPRPYKILAISQMKYRSEQLLQWSWEGRRDIYSSHRFR